MSTNINGVTNRDIYVLSAAATGAAINRADNSAELKSYLLFGGGAMALPTAFKGVKSLAVDLPVWTYNNYGDYRKALQEKYNSTIGKTNLYKNNRDLLKGNFKNAVNENYLQGQLKSIRVPEYNISSLETERRNLERLGKVFEKKESDTLIQSMGRALKRNSNKNALVTNANNLKKAEIYSETNRLLAEAQSLKGKDLAAKLDEIKIAETRAQIAVKKAKASGEITRASKLGKTASLIKTKTGVRTLETKVWEGTLSKNTAVKTLAKGAKAGGAMFAISAAMEAPTVVKTYKELGTKSGNKQLAKSTAKVAAETAGFIVGTKVAGIAGAKIGAAVGTAIGGPIGTAVGAVVGGAIGVIGGLLGSWLCGKATKAIVGEDELDKAKKQQAEALAKESENNPELQAEIALAAKEQLENGNITSEKDANDVIESFNKVAETYSQTQDLGTPSTEDVYSTIPTKPYVASIDSKETDDGLNALYAMANGNFTSGNIGNYYTPIFSFNYNNPFIPMFQNNYSNSIMQNNILGMNYFNPFRQYYNPAA